MSVYTVLNAGHQLVRGDCLIGGAEFRSEGGGNFVRFHAYDESGDDDKGFRHLPVAWALANLRLAVDQDDDSPEELAFRHRLEGGAQALPQPAVSMPSAPRFKKKRKRSSKVSSPAPRTPSSSDSEPGRRPAKTRRYRFVATRWHRNWENYAKLELRHKKNRKKKKKDNQQTAALGWTTADGVGHTTRFLGVRQTGPMPTTDTLGYYGFFPPPEYRGEVIADARKIALNGGTWTASNSTGIHAEMYIVRAWLISMNKLNLEGLTRLKGRCVIVASQPACWCCRAFMELYGIAFFLSPNKSEQGKKPRTGWRHPLAKRTIPNSALPDDPSAIDKGWIENAAHL